MSSHTVVHVDFSANDPEASGKFYGDLFGWEVTPPMPEFGNYATFAAAPGPGGGFAPVGEHTSAGSVLVYISTDDIDATLAKAEALGGTTVVPKSEIPGVGWMGVFTDPTGNRIGLFTNR